MSDDQDNVVPFPIGGKPVSERARRQEKKKRAQGRTLCGRGFHKWRVDTERRFDVKKGRLITLRRCERCGATRTTAD